MRHSGFFNAITLLIFLVVLGVITVGVAALLAPPPLPEITPLPTSVGELPTVTATPTSTATATPTASLPPSFTPKPSATNTATPTETHTQLPTATPLLPSITPSLTLTLTPTATFTETPIPFLYVAQGNVEFSANTANTLGCAWQGMGGRVLGDSGELTAEEASALYVHLISDELDARARVGSNSLYGALTGWEITIGSRPTAMLAYVRLETEDGVVQSPDVLVRFSGDCTTNLARLNFIRNERFTP